MYGTITTDTLYLPDQFLTEGEIVKKTNLLDFTLEELKEYVEGLGIPKYRAGQIRKNIYKGVFEFSGMTDLPLETREKLDNVAHTGKLEIVRKLESKVDGTRKYLFDLGDGNVIESVLMKYRYGYSACISSQVGCKMGCRFCASTGLSFERNLTSGEMISQILTMQSDTGARVGNIVIMGIGEPLDNYDNVVKFIRQAGEKDGLGISMRKISLSTCGVIPGILRLAEENLPITLSVSLHSPYDGQRAEMMPVSKKYPIDELINACRAYVEKTGRRITFEYAMISGVNDTREHADELVRLVKGMLCHVNLIPVNKIQTSRYERSREENIRKFEKILGQNGISVTVRRELGPDIEAACGQLRRTKV